MAEWRIEALADDHVRGEFSCGKVSLDVFIRTQAGQYERRGVGRTFVAVRTGERVVVGYYTLAASTVEFEHLPPALSKKLPRHPIPMLLLGRLAVDRTARGERLGRGLLTDAFRRSLHAAEAVGVYAVHVHALDDEARAFYAHFGFTPLPDAERHMFLPLTTIRKSFE